MKIKYEFANETVEIEVDEQWGAVLIDLDREEYNNDHAETRRHCSLDQLTEDGNDWIAGGCDIEGDLLGAEDQKQLASAIARLEPRQQKLIRQVFFEGRKSIDIAQEEGVCKSAISHALDRAIKKLKNILS